MWDTKIGIGLIASFFAIGQAGISTPPPPNIKPRPPKRQGRATYHRIDEASYALDSALANHLLDSAKNALANGAKPDVKYWFSSLANISFKSPKDQLEMAELLIQHGADPNFQRWDHADTPLTTQIRFQREERSELVSFLLDHGADINQPGFQNLSALQMAIEGGQEKIVKILLAHHADLTVKATWPPAEFDTPFKTEDLLSDSDLGYRSGGYYRFFAGRTPVFGLGINWNPEIAEMLVAAGADFKQKDDFGWTVLHLAALRNNVHGIEGLLKKGLDINAKTAKGNTPLHLATLTLNTLDVFPETNDAMFDILIAYGADLKSRNQRGETPADLLRTNARTILHWFKSTPGFFSRYHEKYLARVQRAITLLDPSGPAISEPGLATGPDGVIYGQIKLGGITPRFPEYDPPQPMDWMGPWPYPQDMLIVAERAVKTSGDKAILTLKFTGVLLDSVTLHLAELQLQSYETTSKLPSEIILKKGVPQTLRFEFPRAAASGGALRIVDKVDGFDASELSDWNSAGDNIDEMEPEYLLSRDGDSDKNPLRFLHHLKGRTIEVEITDLETNGVLDHELIGKKLLCQPDVKNVLLGTSGDKTKLTYRWRVIPNKVWREDRY